MSCRIEPLSCLTIKNRGDRMRSFLFKGSDFDIWKLISQERIKQSDLIKTHNSTSKHITEVKK